MTIGGVAGMLMTAPAGALDRREHAQAALRHRARHLHGARVRDHSAVRKISGWSALSQVATAIAGAAIGPAVAGITLGIVRPGRFQPAERTQPGVQPCRQHGWRRAVRPRSAGSSASTAVFCACRGSSACSSIVSVLMIPRAAIDDEVARGLKRGGGDHGKASGFTVLRRMQAAAGAGGGARLFHLGNAAMLPLYGLAVVAAKQGDPAEFVAHDDRRGARA